MVYTVYIDLDDTLLNREKRISDYTYDVLVKFQGQGNNIVLATARSKQLYKLPENVKKVTPHFIFHNGGEVVSNGIVIYQGFFSIEQTQKIGGYLTEHLIKAAVILDDEYYANYNAPLVWGEINNYHFTTFSNATFCAPKFSILLDAKSQMEEIDALKDCAQVTYIDNFSSAIVAPKNVSKGVAVKIFQQRIFKEGKSIYIGNDYNDIPGFEACDIKVAVANADQTVLNRADQIIDSNLNDGVAYYLNSLLL